MRYNRTGGALIDFHLHELGINPLNFDVPYHSPNGKQLRYQGHFICLGRWGDPSTAEEQAGLVKHGDILLQQWKCEIDGCTLSMHAASPTEGLNIERKIELDVQSACYSVTEKVTNINTLGRLYNVMQHPTIAQPFLYFDTIVDCNAGTASEYIFENCVFPFVINNDEEFGWITAYSPLHQLLMGYAWKRSDYPWINHWIHQENGQPTYRGLEFGTTGIHLPFKEMIDKQLLHVLGESTCRYIDPGETHERSFIGFQLKVPSLRGVERIYLNKDSIEVIEKDSLTNHILSHQLKINELLK